MSVLKMSHKERQRVEVFARVKRRELTLTRAAELIGLGYRQALRSYARYQQLGDRGVVHRGRGKASNHRSAPVNRQRVLALYAKKYGDFGPTLAAEYLVHEDKLRVSVTTLRRWLIAAQLWKPKPLRSPHRKWRERKANFGELVQIDGSRHAWLEGRGPQWTLMVMIDDATNWTYARFYESESLESAMRVFQGYVEWYGLPRSLYSDRHGIYVTTRDATVDEALANTAPPTQFARAMKTLGVQLILANSPQAKGRVERRHQVFQDRLVKALRLKKITTMEAANAFLDSAFLADLNERFHETARSPADVHRDVPRHLPLVHVLCVQEERVVQNDWTVSWCNRILQVSERHQKLTLAKKKVMVSQLLDGTLRLTYRGQELSWQELPARPPRIVRPPANQPKLKPTRKPSTPAADHPWRNGK